MYDLMDGWTELARARTGAGDELVLRERAGCVELRCNGWELMSNRAHHSEEALAALACTWLANTARGQPRPDATPGATTDATTDRATDTAIDAITDRATETATDAIPDRATNTAIDAPSAPTTETTPHAPPNTPHVLIGGLGLGYTLRAALDRLPASARVSVAELLPEIVAWNHGPLAPLTGHPLADPRVTVTCADVAAWLRTAPPATFDAILLDIDNGPESIMLGANAALYAADGLRLIRRALRRPGVLAVWSADRSPRFQQALNTAGFVWRAHDVPARGGPDDPLHTIYLAWQAA